MTNNFLIENFKHLTATPQNVEQLKKLVLQMAVQGKLTAQWRADVQTRYSASPEILQSPDYNASALLEKIKAEKEQLIKEGKIKRQKHLPPIADEEKPFELPESWEWVRLNNLSNKIHYGFNASAKTEIKDVRLLRITDIQNNRVDWKSVPGCNYSKKDIENYQLSENDILIARTGGTIGKSYLVKNIDVVALFASYLIRVVPNPELFPEYLKYYIESPSYWKQLYDYAWGAGQPNVNGTNLSKLVVPLPPLAEQQAIVSKVEQLMAWCDELEKKIEKRDAYQDKMMQAVVKNVLTAD